MLRSRGLGRLGLRAVGLGVGAALAATPWVASADSSNDWLSSTDQLLGGLSVPAADTAQDMQISIDGTPLIYGPNTAFAFSGPGSIAIAIGDNSYASAQNGMFDFAFADGSNSMAEAEEGNFDVAVADGSDSFAEAGGLGINNSVGFFDLAAVYGDNLIAQATVTPFLVDIVPHDVPLDQVVSSFESLLSTLESLLSSL
jgi:hypothetical protein